jgi:hypothetical protein
VLDVLKNNPIDNEQSLNREKARIKIELDEFYSRPVKYLEQQSLITLYRGPGIVTREKTLQNISISKMGLKDLQKLRENLLSKHFVGVIIGAHKLPKRSRTELLNDFSKWLPSGAHLTEPKKIEARLSKTRKRILRHVSIEKGYAHVSLIWPGLSMESSLSQRFTLGYICSELLDKLEKPLGDAGVYRYDYQYQIYDKYGLVRFWGYVPKNATALFEKIVYDQLKLLVSDKKKIDSGVKKFIIERTKRLKRSWKNNLSRMDWVIDDILDFGESIPLLSVISELKKVGASSVRREAENVLNKGKQHTLIVGHK